MLEETGLHVHNVSLCSIVDTIEAEQDYHYITVFMRGYVDETRGSEPRNMEPQKCEGTELRSPQETDLFLRCCFRTCLLYAHETVTSCAVLPCPAVSRGTLVSQQCRTIKTGLFFLGGERKINTFIFFPLFFLHFTLRFY